MTYSSKMPSNRFLKFRCLFVVALATILSLLALSVLAPSTAWAETETTPIVIDDPAQDTSGSGWSWVSAGSSGTLTLKDLDMNLDEVKASAITVPDGATIHLIGENKITTNVTSANSGDYAGIYCEGVLNITGETDSSLSITANGLRTCGINCIEDLNIGSAELVINASTTEGDDGSTGIFVGGNAVINNGATVSSTGSYYSLQVKGALNITDAALVELILTSDDSLISPSALSVGGETMISGVDDEVTLIGGGASFGGEVTISNTELSGEFLPSPSTSKTSQTLLCSEGLEIVNGSVVKIETVGDAIEARGDVLVQNSSLTCYSEGDHSVAIRLFECDLTADNSKVYAFGDDTSSGSVGILLNREQQDGAFNGFLNMNGNVELIAEGSQAGFVAWSESEQWEDDPIVVDPEVGAIEGGMLSYAENTLDGVFRSVWTYSNKKVTVESDNDTPVVKNASSRVEFRAVPISIFVTDEGDPVSGLTSIKAIADDGTEYSATEWLDGSHSGYYRFLTDLPDGNYMVEIGGGYEAEGAVMTVSDNPTIYPMDFCTVKIKQADNALTWGIQPSTGERVSVIEHILIGNKVQLGTQPDEGYVFAGYSATGTAPTWENADASKADQTVIINGSTVIISSVKATDASVANGADNNSGSSALAKTGDPFMPFIGIIIALAVVAAFAIAVAVRMRHKS